MSKSSKQKKKTPTNQKEMIESKKTKGVMGKIKSLPGDLYNKFQAKKKNKLSDAIGNTKKALSKSKDLAAFVTYPAGTRLSNGTIADGRTQYNNEIVKPATAASNTSTNTGNNTPSSVIGQTIGNAAGQVMQGAQASGRAAMGQVELAATQARIQALKGLLISAPPGLNPATRAVLMGKILWADAYIEALRKATLRPL